MIPTLLHLGPLRLHTYGLLVAVGFLLALRVTRRTFQRQRIPLEWVDQLAVVLILAGVFGARLFYFGAVGWEELWRNPVSFLKVWEGGLVYYGGFLGGVIALVVFVRRKNIPFLVLSDALVAPLLLAQAIGRLGCFAAGCCYGRPTDSMWGVVFTHAEALAPRFVRLLPTQLYASVGNFLLFWAALRLTALSPRRGVVTALYLVGYGAVRFVIEFFRGDDRGAFVSGLSPAQWISLAAIAAGAAVYWYGREKRA